MRYHADITAGSLKLPESRIIADLLIRGGDQSQWHQAIVEDNVLQARSPRTAKRLTGLLRARLETMDSGLWRLVRDGSFTVATHACLAAAVKHSHLLGDFMDLVLRDQYRLRIPKLAPILWERYIEACRSRDPGMPQWRESTILRLRSSVFQILAQAGYLDSTRSLTLQRVYIVSEVLNYLQEHNETHVLRCLKVHA